MAAALTRQGHIKEGIGNILNVFRSFYTKRGLTAIPWSQTNRQQLITKSSPAISRSNWVTCNCISRSLATKARRMIPFDSSKFSEQPIIYINSTYNNTMLTLTDHKGNTLAWTSAGSEGYKNSKRGTSVAAQQASVSLAKKASEIGIQKVRVKIKGVGNGRQASVKSLVSAGIVIVSLTDVTPIPHNGCRPKKARRK